MISKFLGILDRPHTDPAAKNFPFLGSPWPVTFLLVTYLIFVLNYGKKFMEHRQPYNVKNVIIIYNFFQVIYNGILFGSLFYYIFIDRLYSLDCMDTLPMDDPKKNIERMILYVYFINKIIDLLDTVFFLLRKSYKQITFLHIFHHSYMVCSIYWIVRLYGFGGQFLTVALANTFVHTVMYFYYMISAIYIGLKQSLWWKNCFLVLLENTQIIGMFSKVLAVFDRPHADPAAKNFPLLGSPWPVTFLILGYLLIVLKFGKKFMEHRQPFEIKKIMIFYNFFQVIYNGITFGSLFYYVVIKPAYPFDCFHTLPLDDPKKNIERMLTFLYFINKIIDLLDTVFFVLRKSYKQITFLHVYHHSAMVCAIYWTVRFYGFGGQFAIVGLANTFVHTVMYFYYMISAIYTGLKQSLWWKKYITKIQIIQFVIGMSHSIYILIFNPEFFDRPHADPAAKDFPLLGSPWPVTLILLTYLFFVLKCGKKFMEHRQPYDIRKVMIVYNLFQVICNATLFGVMFYYYFINPVYPLDCLNTLPFDDPNKNIERMMSYAYFVNKITDLLDTIFIVLRKSYKQITFLHVFHHTLMVFAIYWVVRFNGFGGQFYTMALANTFVHTVMYFYYMISAIYTGLKGSLWWKNLARAAFHLSSFQTKVKRANAFASHEPQHNSDNSPSRRP
ncbi:hypothetical protein ACLKA7_014327 [Drosophila subpalustris]